MFAILIQELTKVLQNRKLTFQVGCVMTGFAVLEVARFLVSDEVIYGVRTIGFLLSAAAFFIAAEIKNSAVQGMNLRYWVVGVGVTLSTITGVIARHYS